jgi:thiosulfate dehydrogenase
MDTDQVIDRASKKAKGDQAKGSRIFVTVCAKCHGFDGKKINFGDEKEPEYLGTVAAGNPWETLHKIRFGQPGQNMPAMIAFPLEMQVDVLAYAQTLPTK